MLYVKLSQIMENTVHVVLERNWPVMRLVEGAALKIDS